METLNLEIGTRLTVQKVAIHSFGTRNNETTEKVIDSITKTESGNIDFVTFKGGKTLYRFCGNRIYSITGPDRNYKII
jgi:hypothetical protein